MYLPRPLRKLREAIRPSYNAPLRKFAPNKSDENKWISSAGIHTVLDIGAHAGESAQAMRSILPSARIYSFEPLAGPYAEMIRLMSEDAGFSAFQFALGDNNGRTEIHANDFSQSSSLLPTGTRHEADFPFTTHTEPQPIEVRRLDDVAADLSLKDNILIKIDVQGYEDRVIAGGARTIGKALLVIIEVSFVELYKGQPLFENVYDSLREFGFFYRGTLNQLLSPVDGQPLQADAIFLKR